MQHCDPADAVKVHQVCLAVKLMGLGNVSSVKDSACPALQDVKSKQSFGIHWGTWALTEEPMDEPPLRLREEAKVAGLHAEEFVALQHGAMLQTSDGQARRPLRQSPLTSPASG